MTFTAVVVSHANERGLRTMLGNLLYQTRKPDEIVVVCSDTDDLARLSEDFPGVVFLNAPDRGDWGHEKRAVGLDVASGEWIGWFNDDDSYDVAYLERLLAHEEDGDAVYCAWNEQPHCEFRKYQSTAGNFVCRTDLARQVGWHGRSYEADGIFIDGLVAAGARVVRVDDVLYHHNVQ